MTTTSDENADGVARTGVRDGSSRQNQTPAHPLLKSAKSAAPLTSVQRQRPRPRQINFAVNCRSGIIPLDRASSATMRNTRKSRREEGRPPAETTEKRVGHPPDATQSGAQNVIGLSNGPAVPGEANALTGHGTSFGNLIRGQDVGIWNYNTLGADTRNTAAHEFAHLLGVDDHSGSVLSNTDPSGRPAHATPSDFGWGIREAVGYVNSIVNGPWRIGIRGELMPPPTKISTTATVGAPLFGWWK